MAAAIPSFTSIGSRAVSVHRVASIYRWVTALIALPFWGLGTWLIYDTTRQVLADSPDVDVGRIVAGVALYGSVVLIGLAGMVWAFRSRVVIDGEKMTVRGTLFTVVITPDQLDGYQYLKSSLHVYLKARKFAVELAYFERQHVIDAWVQARTWDARERLREEERKEIARDTDLGLREADKDAHLARLRRGIQWGNAVIYAACVAAVANFFVLEWDELARFSIAVLVLIPFVLELAALMNRGHIRIDYDEGSRYPQILSAALASGLTLAFVALFDPGAMLDTRAFIELLVTGTLIKGFIWVTIDRDRLNTMKQRGPGLAFLTGVGLFVMPTFWVGGGLYLVNKHFDRSAAEWHATEVVAKQTGSSSLPTFEIDVAAWDDSLAEPVTIKVRRSRYGAFEAGMPVQVAVRDGALGLPWVAALEPATGPAQSPP